MNMAATGFYPDHYRDSRPAIGGMQYPPRRTMKAALEHCALNIEY